MSLRATVRRRVNAVGSAVLRTPAAGRILLYHHIREHQDPIENVPPGLFRSQLQWIRAAGLRCVSIADDLESGFPGGVVGLSFDDGYTSVMDACEQLLEIGFSATVFVPPGWVEQARPGVVDWHQLRRLADRGIEVASHGLTHERLNDLSDVDDALRRSREMLQDRLGAQVSGIAYPYGLARERVRAAARRVGYRYGCVSEPGRNDRTRDFFALRRNEVLGTDATPGLLLGKLAGTDDWMGPVRAFENRWRR